MSSSSAIAALQCDQVSSMGTQEGEEYNYLTSIREKAKATHSGTLAWEIPWMEEPGRLQFMGWQRLGHDWVTSLSHFTFMHWRKKWQPTPVFLPGESQGREPGGLPSMGLHRVRRDWHDLVAAAPIRLQLFPAVIPYGEPCWKFRIVAPDDWDAYRRNDFGEPRLLCLPIHKEKKKSVSHSVLYDSLQPHRL